MKSKICGRSFPLRELLLTLKVVNSGVRAIIRVNKKCLAIGAGDGTVELVEELSTVMKKTEAGQKTPSIPAFQVLKTHKFPSMVTSLCKLNSTRVLIGTQGCDIYSMAIDNFKTAQLHITCHPSPVHCIALPQQTNEVFVTCGYGDVRIWRLINKPQKLQEVHRIIKTAHSCFCVLVTKDGSAIVSAWSDGTIRIYTPESGRLITEITGAHRLGVTALGVTSNVVRIISGGQEGKVRIWDYKHSAWKLTKEFANQRGIITQLVVRENDEEAATACISGTCCIWKIRQGEEPSCKATLQTNSKLAAVAFVPSDDSVILTGNLDRRITCWDIAKGIQLHEIETESPVTSLSMPLSKNIFVSGFEDGSIKVYSLLKGIPIAEGSGHGAKVTCVVISHDGQSILSASEDGGIFCWVYPHYEDNGNGNDEKTGENDGHKELQLLNIQEEGFTENSHESPKTASAIK